LNESGTEIENSTLWQTEYLSKPYFKYNLNVAVPRPKETFVLILFAKLRKEEKKYHEISKFHLIRTNSDQNDTVKFCQSYGTSAEFNINSPVEFDLKQNQVYEFNYFIRDALKVALVDSKSEWVHFERPHDANNLWVLSRSFSTLGKLTLYAQFDGKSSYDGICFYQIVPSTNPNEMKF
jgi:hypothetical protein